MAHDFQGVLTPTKLDAVDEGTREIILEKIKAFNLSEVLQNSTDTGTIEVSGNTWSFTPHLYVFFNLLIDFLNTEEIGKLGLKGEIKITEEVSDEVCWTLVRVENGNIFVRTAELVMSEERQYGKALNS